MAGPYLFTDLGERVPRFQDVEVMVGGKVSVIDKHGWQTVRTWTPGFIAVKRGRGYALHRVQRSQNDPIHGSVYQLRVWDWLPAPQHEIKRLPTVAALEMYVRHRHANIE